MTTNAATDRERLAREFTNGEVLQFTKEWRGKDGREHSMTFDYIEDETVMDRLDEVYGVGGWSLTVEPISAADGIVKVTLHLGYPDGPRYEDFGYATRTDGEPLKEAVSDGIRRVGRMVGIARYLYKKHPAQNGSGRPQAQRPPLRAVSQPKSVPDDPYGELDDLPFDVEPESNPAVCATHGEPWKGTPGDLYHKKAEGGYCRHPENVQKPARAR